MVLYGQSARDAELTQVGAKAYNLGRLARWGLPVPTWTVVPADAFRRHVNKDVAATDETGIPETILDTPIATELETALHQAVDELQWHQTKLAVRSSAIGEDSESHSFAGQLDSFLYVKTTDLAETIKRVWASAYSERAVAYRRRSGLTAESVAVAVVIQEMVDADVSGVAFGMDPVSGDRCAVVVSAVYGVGEGLVSGRLEADTFTVRRIEAPHQIEVERSVVTKSKQLVLDHRSGSGTQEIAVPPEQSNRASLDHSQLLKIDALTRRLGKHFGKPQDIEWALCADRVFLLQSRPVTTLGTIPDRTDVKRIWDNANIIESYGGVTTPLTFSFVQDIYTEVYQHFCRIMGVEEELIGRNREIFSMLGLIKGRIYYNLLNWYKVLSLLPGYAINAGFMEQMMGVREELELPPTVVHSSRNRYLRVAGLLRRLVVNLFMLPRRIRRFYRLLDTTLAPYERADLDCRSPQELVDTFRGLEKRLLDNWQPPLVNDFYAMVFYGLLRKLTAAWVGDQAGTLQNDLLCGEGGMISTAPIAGIQTIAATVSTDGRLREFIVDNTDEHVVTKLSLADREGPVEPHLRELSAMVAGHIDRFGNRCAGELKLETVTPRHDPRIVIPLIRSYLVAGVVDPEESRLRERRVRREAQQTVSRALRLCPIKRLVFGFVLRNARRLVKNRENMRFERTRLFAVVRELFLACGRRFRAEGILDNPRDIFYLSKQEIFGYIEGTSVCPDLRATVALRRVRFESYKQERVPDRFETFGPVYHANPCEPPSSPVVDSGGELKGTGCCPGVVRARVRLVHDPADAGELEGCIMAAARTDPGWAPLFPIARGIVVERGSLLSHSAIVAREMGIAAVVGVPGLMDILHDGEEIEIDGAAGTVRTFRNGQGDGRED